MKQVGAFKMLPPAPDVCQECARKHNPEWPHDCQSLYYQYAFYADHDRWPNWADAMSHCTDEMKAIWKAALIKQGITEDQFVQHEK